MEYRAIANTNLRVSALGLGTSRLTSISTGLSRQDAMKLIAVAADRGINFIDTADIYGQGDSEAVIGNAIRSSRERFIVATKAGYRFREQTGLFFKAMPLVKRALRPFKGARRLVANVRNSAHQTNLITQDFSPSYLVGAIDSSLRRLGTDYIDILYLHDVPADFETSEPMNQVLSKIQRAGKVRYFGISAESDSALETACGNPLMKLVQTDLHPPCSRAILSSLNGAGKGVVVNKVLSRGHDQTIAAFANRHGTTIRQALLGFALRQPFVASVLTGTTNADHLIENLSCVAAAKLLPYEELVV